MGAGPRPVPGQAVLDLVIDIPFALPTIVAGLVLLSPSTARTARSGSAWANTQRAVFLALAFVTLPFIVRTVQPVLEELDTDVEEAAASLGASRFTTFRRVILPTPGAGDLGRRRALASRGRSASTARWSCSRATCRSGPR